MAKLTKEERQRNQRRRSRQMIGFIMTCLVLVGCIAIIRSGASLVASVFDDTEQKEEYASKLVGLVLFDPLPFDGTENIQDATLREAAIWGTIYRIMASETGFDTYDRNPETDQVMLPSIEVDAYLANIFGPSFKMGHKTFEMEGMTIMFDEVLQCYYIPITSVVGEYIPQVEALFKEDGRLYATVGYIPVETSSTIITVSNSAQVTKYMDYVFERTDGNWYLVGLQESKSVAPVTESVAPTTSSVPALEDFESIVLEDLANSQSEQTDESTEGETNNENAASESDASVEADTQADASSDSEA